MASLRQVSVLLAGVGLASAHKDKSEFVQAIQQGHIHKSQVELVLAHHDEDLSWSEPWKSVRTVYCKGSICDADSVKLPNLGREGHTFLHHIVHNYENLSNWTVFSQAGAPTEGYFGHQKGGGHMLSGAKFEDYMVPSNTSDCAFLMTTKVHLPSLRHSFRSAFQTRDDVAAPAMHAESATCPLPKDEGDLNHEDVWAEFQEVPALKTFLEKKCSIEATAMPKILKSFWQDTVKLPMPFNEVVHFSQGARFAVSKARLQQRSKAFYQGLLEMVSNDEDPCMNYLYEWVWYYLTGVPTAAPCASSAADVEVSTLVSAPVRSLAGESGGISGGDGGGDGGVSATAGADRTGFTLAVAVVAAAAVAIAA